MYISEALNERGIKQICLKITAKTGAAVLLKFVYLSYPKRGSYFYPPITEKVNRKKTFSFGHCQNHLTPPPDPNSGNLVLFFGRQKRRFARMTEIFFDDDNDGFNNNYNDNFGNFDDNYDKID